MTGSSAKWRYVLPSPESAQVGVNRGFTMEIAPPQNEEHPSMSKNEVNTAPPSSKRARLRRFVEKHQRRLATLAAVCFIAGALVSRQLHHGVRVEKVTLAGDTPALKFIPAGPGPHPVALLAHGYSGSKENLSWYAEALSGAGFLCYSVDLPGHGESRKSFSLLEASRTLGLVADSIGPVDVFVGHSMGGFAGGEAVREGLLHPKLVIAAGSNPQLGNNPPPLLLLIGRFDEFFKPDELKTRTDAQLIVSPWANHGFELFDPLLINDARNAATEVIGQPPPPAFTGWIWHFAGVLLALLGAAGLALALPDFPPQWAWARGLLIAAFFGSAYSLTLSTCLDLKPHPQNIPWQILATVIATLVLVGAGKLRIPRWTFAMLAFATAIVAVIATNTLMAQWNIPLSHIVRIFLVFAPVLLVGTLVGMIAAFRGSRFSGDVAMATIVGFGLFQLGNAPRTVPAKSETHHPLHPDATSHTPLAWRFLASAFSTPSINALPSTGFVKISTAPSIIVARTLGGISSKPVRKRIGSEGLEATSHRSKSTPEISGMERSATRQPAAPAWYCCMNSRAEPNTRVEYPFARSNRASAFATAGSSSTTKTVCSALIDRPHFASTT